MDNVEWSCKLLHSSEAESTMDLAKAYAKSERDYVPQPVVFIADRQTKGRGRLGSPWASQEGGLYYSFLYTPSRFDFGRAEQFQLDLADIVAEFLSEYAGVTCDVKAPNDVMIFGQKVAGILTETASMSTHNRPQYVIVGIGINVNQSHFEPGLSDIATSLHLKTGQIFDKMALAADLTKQISRYVEKLQEMEDSEYV